MYYGYFAACGARYKDIWSASESDGRTFIAELVVP